MRKADYTPQDATGERPVTYTLGEFFPDGSLVEPVASRDGGGLDLLFKNGGKGRIAQEIEHEGRL
jgi:hypothetical protein